jgi:hypothetical protein
MIKSNKLAALFTGTAAVLMLSGTSAFADSRHRAETRNDWQQTQQTQRRDTAQFNRESRMPSQSNQRWDRSQTQPSLNQSNQRWDRSQTQASVNRSNQRWDRSQTQASQSNRFDSRSNNQAYRGSYAAQAYRGSYNQGPARNESRSFSGRVNRVERYNGGFRVWVGGAQYPFFIGADRWSRFPLRVGLNIRLGGYWDPLGYYNVYDVGPYAYSTGGDIRGVVESVDYRRGTAVLRDDVSGSFVTVLLRGNDPRLGELRTGDYVDLAGVWSRSGVFDAVNVADLRQAGYGYGGPAPQYDAPPPY